MQMTSDLSGLRPEVRNALIKRLQREDAARYAVGAADQLRLKRYHDEVSKAGAFNDVGPVNMILSRDQYQRAMAKYGPLCFMDKNFTEWLLKRNEDMRVKQSGTRIQVGWSRPCE